jgi:hypothetical protein
MLVGYGFGAFAARPGRTAHSIATKANVIVIVVTIFLFIGFPLRSGFQYTFETFDD